MESSGKIDSSESIQSPNLAITSGTNHRFHQALIFNELASIMANKAEAEGDLMRYWHCRLKRLHKSRKLQTNKIRLKKSVRQGDSISPKLFTECLESDFRNLN
ncbi:hypothetical protein GQR58_016391 [Nymphon striatum]|nr:hypothetical protein GQR58_016391 [Nymphon striatum]